MGKDTLNPPPSAERRIRRTRLDEKIREYDEQAFDAMNDEAYFEMNCPYCGKKLSSKLTDNIFTCPYCGQKFGDFDRLSTGDFDANLIVGRKMNFYGKCLPFHLSREDAVQAVGSLKRRYPQDFAGDEDVIRAIEPATPHVFNAHGERTMTSPPIPVKYVKQPFLHEKLRIEDAFEKKGGIGGFFSKLFG